MQIHQPSTGKELTLREVPVHDPDWRATLPTEMVDHLFVSEMPGTINGSIYGYWIGDKAVDSPDVVRAIQSHVEQHDVVGLRYIRALPETVHPAIASKLSLENPVYVTHLKSRWSALPLSMIVIEYAGTGDPFFGGNADDRAMGIDGTILTRNSMMERAVFSTIEAAHQAAINIPNRRPHSSIGVAPQWR